MSSKETPTSASVISSINSAVSQNQISAQSGSMLLESLDPIALGGCAGLGVDDIDSEEVTLIACVIDASSSMNGNRSAVINSYKEQFLKPLQGAKNANDILVETWIFNTEGAPENWVRLLHGFTPVKSCTSLDKSNYKPSGCTPLYDAVNKAQTGIMAYGQTLRDGGTRTKCIIVVISDGWENSSNISAPKVKKVSRDMLKQEIYVLSYVFFGPDQDAKTIAGEIGFPDHHRLTGQMTDSEIRDIFGTVSASVISASQTKVSSTGLSSNPFFAGGSGRKVDMGSSCSIVS